MQDFRRVKGVACGKAGKVAKAATESYPVQWEYPSGAEAVTRDDE